VLVPNVKAFLRCEEYWTRQIGAAFQGRQADVLGVTRLEISLRRAGKIKQPAPVRRLWCSGALLQMLSFSKTTLHYRD